MEYTNANYIEDLKISKHIFKKHFKFFEDYKSDLIQESLIYLWKARQVFDETKSSYITFAYRTSKNAMLCYIRKLQKELFDISIFDNLSEDLQIIETISNMEYENSLIKENYISLVKKILHIFKINKTIQKRNKLYKQVIVKYFIYNQNQSSISREFNISRARTNEIVKETRTILQKSLF